MNCFTTSQQFGEYSGCCLFQQNIFPMRKKNIKTGQHFTLGNKNKYAIKRNNTQNKERTNIQSKVKNKNKQKDKVSLSKTNSKNSSIQKSKLHPTKDQTLQNISNPTQSGYYHNNLHLSFRNSQGQNNPNIGIQKSEYFDLLNKKNEKDKLIYQNKNRSKGQYANKYNITGNRYNIQNSLNSCKNQNINHYNQIQLINIMKNTKETNANINVFFGNKTYTFNKNGLAPNNRGQHFSNINVRNQNRINNIQQRVNKQQTISVEKKSMSRSKNILITEGQNENKQCIQNMNKKLVKSVVSQSQVNTHNVQQSIIVMDFFNPSQHQKKIFQANLKRKTQYYNS